MNLQMDILLLLLYNFTKTTMAFSNNYHDELWTVPLNNNTYNIELNDIMLVENLFM